MRQNSWKDFAEIKKQIKNQNPSLYNKLGLETINSFDTLIFWINNKKSKFEKQKKDIIKNTKNIIKELIAQNTKEAQEIDEQKKIMLKFLNSIGFDLLPQNKTNLIIDYINLKSWKFGLENKINFENWNLWFNKDFWNKTINTLEKRNFIELFNHILWEDIIDENIANWFTSLTAENISAIQVLWNRTTWFFIENLDKRMGVNK